MVDEDTIRRLNSAGMLRGKYSDYKRFYMAYQEQRSKGKNYEDACYLVGDKFGASDITVKRAVSAFKKIDDE